MKKTHREMITLANREFYGRSDGRSLKRFERRHGMGHPVEMAYRAGEWNASSKHPKANPFPPGRRHDAWEQGFNMADPMGDWHGRNE